MGNRSTSIAGTCAIVLKVQLILLAILLNSYQVLGRNFYFSNTNGDDSRTSTQAQNPATPWKTIYKLRNTAFAPGDSILFRRGDTWIINPGEPIHSDYNGTSAAPIIFGAYGTGEKPTFSGFATISDWIDEGNGIYSKVIPCEANPEMETFIVTVDGINTPMGRYPDSDWLTYESVGSTEYSITDNQLSGTPNWTGAEAVIKKHYTGWMVDRNKITNHINSKLVYIPGSNWGPISGYGYFIQNDIKTLTTLGEWYYDEASSKFYMYFGNVDPASKIVKFATINYGSLFYYNSYMTFVDLSFSGFNNYGIYNRGSHHITIQNCNVELAGFAACYVSRWDGGASYLSFIGNTISNSSSGIAIHGTGTNMLVSSNTIYNIGTFPGQCAIYTDDNAGDGIILYHNNSVVEYNKVTNVGHSGIRFGGENIVVRYNYINGFAKVRNDAGGIYTWNAQGSNYQGCKILNNIVVNGNFVSSGMGNLSGADLFEWGIYLDENSHNILISDNTTANCPTGGIVVLSSVNDTIVGNTSYNNSNQLELSSMWFNILLRGFKITDNILIAKESNQYAFSYHTKSTDLDSLGLLNFNYYARPIDDNKVFKTKYMYNNPILYNLNEWKSVSLQDVNSHKSPIAITDTSDFYFLYNTANENLIVDLPYSYIDVKGVEYNSSVTLEPFTSKVLIKKNSTVNNLSPVILNQNFQINENSPLATLVGMVAASDPDTGQMLTYSIIDGNNNNAFAIDAITGALTVNNTTALDYEVMPAFSLLINVEDNGPGTLSSQATITVNLLNVNEPPVAEDQTFNISETPANGTIVGYIPADDPDTGQILNWTIQSGNTSNAFSINSTTGALTVDNSSAITYLTNPLFNLVVRVTEVNGNNLYDDANVTINVLQGTNQAPVILNQTFTIAENSPNGTFVGTIVASDPDAGQILTYSIISGNTGNAFTLSPFSGSLTVNNTSVLNYEVTPSFNLVIKVQDNGIGSLSSQASVVISLQNINEAPIILSQSFSVFENLPNGSAVGTVIASDPDAGQTLTYSIVSGNTGSAFAINASTGALTVNTSSVLNYEVNPSFALVIKVQDNGTGSLSSQATITVSLLNVNEAPVIANQSFSINENSANGTLVGNVVASDPDAGQILTYSIVSGNTSNAFNINASTGSIIVYNASVLNYEINQTFLLIIKVQDNGTGMLSNQATITVNILNVNEAPVIANQAFSINENSANGTLVGNVVASDPDAGQTLTYSIVSGNTGSAFAINASTGALTVNTSSVLNYEVNPSFALVIKVQDNGTGSLSSQATITVSLLNVNEAPIITNQAFSINENSANGTLVGNVIASDPDAGQTLTYSIVSGNTGSAFAINASTGALTVNTSSVLNYEVNPSFALVIKVQDNGTGSLSSQATITVSLLNVNEAPVIANQAFSINENSANGTLVGNVIASDPDAGQTLTYSIVSGNTGSAFAINASTGALTVNTSSVLNYEVNPSFALVVKVQDNGTGSLSSQATITVSLLNVNEAPVIANQAFSINENSANGTLVGNVIASDPDAGQTLTYSIVSGNTGSAFAINASTGALTVNNSSVLNYEVNPSFALVVKVQDNGTGSLSSQATITVSLLNVNEAPVIANQAFSINENSANGTLVGNVIASDPDAGQTLTYSIVSGNTGSAFAINASTGALTVNTSSVLDFEVNPSFALVVKVQDNGTGSLSSQATITVSLLNINEAPVIANQAFSINENSANGTLVGNVIASDPDAGQTLTYSIVSGNTGSAFAINASTGALTVNTSSVLNYEVNPSFALVVKVQDNGTGSLSSQATITVSLLNVNEAPVIANQAFSINENSANGTLVGNVIASDPDAGQTLTYSIVSGNTGSAFAINASTGALTVNTSSALNYEVNPSFALVVKVQDNGTGSLSSQATITVSLLNVNEAPVIANQAFSINENSANGTLVGNVIASDPDAGQTLTYSIVSGNTGSAFAINASTGALTVNNSSVLNYEVNPSFALVVKVQDNGTGSLSSQATITVSLLNVNEAPVIANQAFSINENSANGTLVGNVIASDPDAGQTLTYSIVSGNTGSAFAINASTGELMVNNSLILNYELNVTLVLIIKVYDNGSGLLSNQATVTILLIDQNEPPIISNQDFSLFDNSLNGTLVGRVLAYDPDAGQSLVYKIAGWNTSTPFVIDSTSGMLSLFNSSLITSSSDSIFNLTVIATDNGNLFSSGIIKIHIKHIKPGTIFYIDPTNTHDQYIDGSITHPYDSWFDFNFTDSCTYLQKRGTIFTASQEITINGLNSIIIGSYSDGNLPVVETFVPETDAFEIENVRTIKIMDLEIRSDGNANSCINIRGGETDNIDISGCYLHFAKYCILNQSTGSVFNLQYCKISSGDVGISTTASKNYIHYNLLTQNSKAIQISELGNASILNNTFFSNTLVSINGETGTKINSNNNIFFLDDNSMKVYQSDGLISSDYNVFNTEKNNFINDYSDLISWSKNSLQDINSLVCDPGFKSIILNDFRLRPGSKCINRGIITDITRDYYGTTVPQAGKTDIGYHEFVFLPNTIVVPSSGSEDNEGEEVTQVTEVKIYPNPSSGLFNINVTGPLEIPLTISVFDLHGRPVDKIEKLSTDKIFVDLTDKPSGTYCIIIYAGDQLFSRKLIKH